MSIKQPAAGASAEFDPERCRNFFEACKAGFDGRALQGLTVDSLEPGVCVCSLPVTSLLVNRYRTLHGGAIATAIDTITTAALVTIREVPGVSVTLTTTYVSPAPLGSTVEITARVVKAGRALATISAEVRLKDSGQVVATGSHTKFVMAAPTSML